MWYSCILSIQKEIQRLKAWSNRGTRICKFNLHTDLHWVAKPTRKFSTRKYTQVVKKTQNISMLQAHCNPGAAIQYLKYCIGWPNNEKLAPTCVEI